ncbi:hypothetical protein D3C83_218540 [compost metagenome]
MKAANGFIDVGYHCQEGDAFAVDLGNLDHVRVDQEAKAPPQVLELGCGIGSSIVPVARPKKP